MLKIFELHLIDVDEKEWIAANTIIEALQTYESTTDVGLHELSAQDEIRELPVEEWPLHKIRNSDNDPDDPNDWLTMTFDKYMETQVHPALICGTAYE